jgi:hypothetical protein
MGASEVLFGVQATRKALESLELNSSAQQGEELVILGASRLCVAW